MLFLIPSRKLLPTPGDGARWVGNYQSYHKSSWQEWKCLESTKFDSNLSNNCDISFKCQPHNGAAQKVRETWVEKDIWI